MAVRGNCAGRGDSRRPGGADEYPGRNRIAMLTQTATQDVRGGPLGSFTMHPVRLK